MLVCKYAVRKQKDNKTIKKIPEPNFKKKKKKRQQILNQNVKFLDPLLDPPAYITTANPKPHLIKTFQFRTLMMTQLLTSFRVKDAKVVKFE